MKIRLGEKEYDLSLALPVTLGDVRYLQREHGIKLQNLADINAETLGKIIFMLCRKVLPTVTEEEVDKLPLAELASVSDFLREQAYSRGEIDRPT